MLYSVNSQCSSHSLGQLEPVCSMSPVERAGMQMLPEEPGCVCMLARAHMS